MTGAGEEPTGFLVQEAVPAVSTARSSVLTLISSAVGAGVLSFGYAFRQTGWLAGLIAVVAIASIEAFTLYVLSRYAEATQSRSYPALVRLLAEEGACRRSARVIGLHGRRCTAAPMSALPLCRFASCWAPACRC